MPISITPESKKTVSRLIRKEFDSIDLKTEYIYKNQDRLIKTAKEFGLLDLANELQNDKNAA